MFHRRRLLDTVFVLVVLGLATLSPPAISPLAAQEAPSPSRIAAFNPLAGITLSADQQRALQTVEAEFATRFQEFAATHNAAIKAAKRAPTRAELDSARALIAERRARVRAMLTAEQQTQYDATTRRIQATMDSLRALARTATTASGGTR